MDRHDVVGVFSWTSDETAADDVVDCHFVRLFSPSTGGYLDWLTLAGLIDGWDFFFYFMSATKKQKQKTKKQKKTKTVLSRLVGGPANDWLGD